MTLLGCDIKQTPPKNHLQKVTLKLEKSLQVKLQKKEDSSNFQITAIVQNPNPILDASIEWVVIDPGNNKILSRKFNYTGPESKKILFNSGDIELLQPELNYKIVFVFNGRTATEEVRKTEIYNSLLQNELDQAIKNLEERGRN